MLLGSAILLALSMDANRLVWSKSLEEAKRRSAAEGKPILMLRLLGRLDEELSCANSRFFRVAVYSDPRVSAYMRENFVLVWTSERPVPRVTIDYGNGRRLQRTLTGNSAHYVLRADGSVVDVLPGLYEPETFLRELANMKRLYESGEKPPASTKLISSKDPNAWKASKRALSKLATEAPLLEKISYGGGETIIAPDLADAPPAKLHPSSIESMRRKHGDDRSFPAALEAFRRNLARDTILNETKLRPVIHRWLSERRWMFEELNRKIYSELFLTPHDDPWLGLYDSAMFTGIEREGIVASHE